MKSSLFLSLLLLPSIFTNDTKTFFSFQKQNSRRFCNVNLCKSAWLFSRRVAKSNFHSATILSENAALVRSNRLRCKLDRPIQVGTAILELSKLVMLKFWYLVAKVHLHDPPRSTLALHMSDTGKVAEG